MRAIQRIRHFKNSNSNPSSIDTIIYSSLGLLLLTISISAFILSSSSVSATGTASDSTSTPATVTVSASCSMQASGTDSHTATLPNGVYSGGNDYYPNGIGQTTIATFCNDPSGYSIYATGVATGGAESNTVLHSSILGTSKDIQTGVYQAGTTTNSTWSMKVSKVTSGSYLPENLTIQNNFDSFHQVPSTYTEVARFSTATDATVGSKITTTYDAYIATNQPAGTYQGQVKYTLVHPGGEEAPDADTLQNVAYWGGELLVGDEVTVTDNRDNKTYTVARLCTSYSGNNCQESQLWMTQNLELDIGKSGTAPLTSLNTDLNTTTDPNGNPLTDYSASGSIISWSPTPAHVTASGVATNNTLNGTPATISDFAYSSAATNVVSNWSNQNNYPYMALGELNGNDVYEYATGSTYDTILTSLQACKNAGHTEAECNHYKIGNYYNFSAANAVSTLGAAYQTQYTVMPNSICPRGWRLPKGLTSDGSTVTQSEFNKLLSAQGVASATDITGGQWQSYASGGFARIQATGIHGDPLYFVRSGYVNGTTLYYSSYNGYYWSSTVQSSTNGYYLRFSSGGLSPASQNTRNGGFSVRCVAR